MDDIPDINANLDKYELLHWDMEPGDITTIEDEGSVEEARDAWSAMRAQVRYVDEQLGVPGRIAELGGVADRTGQLADDDLGLGHTDDPPSFDQCLTRPQ